MTNIRRNKKFIKAAKEGKLRIVKFLLEKKGANIHAEGDNALISASTQGKTNVVKYLVEKGANIHADKDRPLITASAQGYLEIIKYLVEKGANIHTENNSPLTFASIMGYLNIVKFLVGKGADIHGNALINAIGHGYLNIVKFLVGKGADINSHNNKELRLASKEKHSDIVKYLVGKGANIDEKIKENIEKISLSFAFSIAKKKKDEEWMEQIENKQKKTRTIATGLARKEKLKKKEIYLYPELSQLVQEFTKGGKRKRVKKKRKHIGINQNTGKLKKGYKYSGKKLKSGLPQIVKN